MLNLIAALVVSASLMPPGKQVYLDNSGNPLSGGRVYTYAAGTSTPLATYSDQAGSTPNANPVVLNSRGEATIFWGAGPYKVTLRTSADALIWTQDNMYPPFTAAEPLKLYSGGNATTPELVWTDDTNSGFYLIGEDNIGLSLGGTKRWDYAAAGSTLTGTLAVTGAATFAGVTSVQYGANAFNVFEVRDGNGGVEFAASTAYVDFKSNPAGDYDARITKTTGGHLEVMGTPLKVMTPTEDTDAATKAYVDEAVALTTTTLTAGASWTLGANDYAVKKGGAVTVHLSAVAVVPGAGWTAVATVGAGFRPGTDVYAPCNCIDLSAGATYLCMVRVDTTGTIWAASYQTAAAGLEGMFAIENGDSVTGSVTYVAQ